MVIYVTLTEIYTIVIEVLDVIISITYLEWLKEKKLLGDRAIQFDMKLYHVSTTDFTEQTWSQLFLDYFSPGAGYSVYLELSIIPYGISAI